MESIALHFDINVYDFPLALNGQGNIVPTPVDSGSSLLFENLQSPGNFLGGEWGIPLEPGQFSYDTQTNSFRFIVQALPRNNFDIWVIQNLEQAYQGTPDGNGTGTAALTFGTDFLDLPQVAEGKVKVTYAAALFSPGFFDYTFFSRHRGNVRTLHMDYLLGSGRTHSSHEEEDIDSLVPERAYPSPSSQ